MAQRVGFTFDFRSLFFLPGWSRRHRIRIETLIQPYRTRPRHRRSAPSRVPPKRARNTSDVPATMGIRYVPGSKTTATSSLASSLRCHVTRPHFASSTIRVVCSSTSLAICANAASWDNADSISTGLIKPIFVLPLSVNTEIRQGSAMFRRISVDRTFAACPGLQTSKILHCSSNEMPLLRRVVPKSWTCSTP